MKRLKISWRGRVSIPEEILQRWNTRDVMVIDRGDRLTLFPMPEDPIEAACGAFKDYPGPPTADEARRLDREEEWEAEERKYGRGTD